MKTTKFIKSETLGDEIFIEVDDDGSLETVELVSTKDSNKFTFEKATKQLKENAKFVIETLQNLGLDEIDISCGLKMGVEGGNSFWGLAKVSSEANITIHVKWKAK
ncbi:hypothetical protein D4R71_00110 [bacterium]|nr:MAG: hypothetical protein D4R71_00110 [bacterium]